ncbi:transmembrane protein 234 isoform X9 [Tachypleus tridentatus]|uniref:transmembrane protein 234 isoform X9 n=1 Tax=Tachypleus tridentatus TaxID=6853 RepID=UPI003FD04866
MSVYERKFIILLLPVFTSHGGGKSLYDFSYSLGLRRVSPMIQFGSVALLIVVSALWGLSTPWLRQGSAGIEHVNYDSAIKQWLAELWFLATNWRYVIPFLVNQSGSVLYAATLGVTGYCEPLGEEIDVERLSGRKEEAGMKLPQQLTVAF